MAQTFNLGKAILTPKGEFSSNVSYEPLDVITYNGSSYLVLESVSGVVPSPESDKYQMLARKGDKGDIGTSPTISLGTYTTGAAGTDVIITNTGTESAAVFNFTIPRGSQGLPGRPTLTSTATIASSAWSNNTATVLVSDVTANATIIVTPSPSSYQVVSDSGIYCSAQGNGSLTFTAMNGAPSSTVTMNVLIFQ